MNNQSIQGNNNVQVNTSSYNPHDERRLSAEIKASRWNCIKKIFIRICFGIIPVSVLTGYIYFSLKPRIIPLTKLFSNSNSFTNHDFIIIVVLTFIIALIAMSIKKCYYQHKAFMREIYEDYKELRSYNRRRSS